MHPKNERMFSRVIRIFTKIVYRMADKSEETEITQCVYWSLCEIKLVFKKADNKKNYYFEFMQNISQNTIV